MFLKPNSFDGSAYFPFSFRNYSFGHPTFLFKSNSYRPEIWELYKSKFLSSGCFALLILHNVDSGMMESFFKIEIHIYNVCRRGKSNSNSSFLRSLKSSSDDIKKYYNFFQFVFDRNSSCLKETSLRSVLTLFYI